MRGEHGGDYMVALSKTLWAAQMRVAGEMAKVKAELWAALPGWMRRLYRLNGGKNGSCNN